jgi:acetyl-CoA acyltransferase
MALFVAGLPVETPGNTVNRLCASGMDAVAVAGRGISTGDFQVAIAGGVESMSRAPFVMPKAENAFALVIRYLTQRICGVRFLVARFRHVASLFW